MVVHDLGVSTTAAPLRTRASPGSTTFYSSGGSATLIPLRCQ